MKKNPSHCDLGYFLGPDHAKKALHRIRAAVATRLKDQPGFKTVTFMDVKAYTIQADLLHEEGAMGGISLPCRVEIAPEAIGLEPRAPWPLRQQVAMTEAEAVELLVAAWPDDPEAALATNRRLQKEFAARGTN